MIWSEQVWKFDVMYHSKPNNNERIQVGLDYIDKWFCNGHTLCWFYITSNHRFIICINLVKTIFKKYMELEAKLQSSVVQWLVSQYQMVVAFLKQVKAWNLEEQCIYNYIPTFSLISCVVCSFVFRCMIIVKIYLTTRL